MIRSNKTAAETMEGWLKPLGLEAKQGYANRSVAGGLDRYMMAQCAVLGGGTPGPEGALAVFLKELGPAFSRYMALERGERAALVAKALEGAGRWGRPGPGPRGPRREPPRPGKSLSDPVDPLVPPEKARAFRLTGLKTVEDLLTFAPKWAVHRSVLTPIAQSGAGEEPSFLLAKINGISLNRRGRLEVLKVNLEDGTGHLNWVWFNRSYLKRELVNGRWVLLHDTPQVSKWGRQVTGRAEAYEFLEADEERALREGKVLPFYPSTPTLTQNFWKSILKKALGTHGDLLPGTLYGGSPSGKLPLAEAVRTLHHPENLAAFEEARRRMAFGELLALQTFLLMRRKEAEGREKGRRYDFDGPKVRALRKSIPYPPTKAQSRVLKEIRQDLSKPSPMNRLLQGDVGSGKTLVAAVCFLYAADSGQQSAFMAPTEILAQQHFHNLQALLGPLGMEIVLLTGDMKAKPRKETLGRIASGKADLVVGTHALLEEGVQFKDLGFLAIDERHKFGVLQRAALEGKGRWPDCLMMTATPFPRALVLTEYGDTDLSLLDEFPKGRKPIETLWRSEAKRDEVAVLAKERMLRGEQVFWIFPAVDESKQDLKSAVQMHAYFQKDLFHGFKVGLLHGKMRKEEKAEVMGSFAKGDLQLLVSTTVVEVGVDVPNATLMVVEHAERFGLAQLHQLRGRVGRGSRASYCCLITSHALTRDGIERMKIMVSTLDGFKLSEFDLRARGPGEIFGLAQSGRREGGLVDLRRDVGIVEEARRTASAILEGDPGLALPVHRDLRRDLEIRYNNFLDLAQIS